MTALATERRSSAPPPGWAGLIGTPRTIIDTDLVRETMAQTALGAGDRAAIRAAIVPILRAAHQAGRAAIAAEVAARPREAHRATQDYAWLMDQIVLLTFELATLWLHPNPNPTAAERVALLAVGGYGRAELAPFSDVDLLFVTPYKQTAWGESMIESMLYCLWDLRLKVGHSVRTIDDCLRLAKSDVTIRTSLLEQRFLVGEQALATTLSERLWSDLFERTGPEFVQLKLAERAERHKRQGGSRYLLEPNVKEGKGGLRDLQTLFWIAKYLNRAQSPAELVKVGAFTPAEYAVFADAADFLWMARVHLHLLSNRPVEQLTFDVQVEIASLLGYQATEGQRAVERFMHDYFLQAKNVGDLTRIFLAVLEARHVKPRPSLGRSMSRVFSFGREATRQGYRLRNGRLDLVDYDAFLEKPVNILRLFQEQMTTGIPIHPDALRLVSANLRLIDDETRADPEANRLFLALLLGRDPERTLRLMNEVGVLGAFMPEFGRIVAMMQFNMYHHYTVDEHTIQAIATLSKIEAGGYAEALPTSSEIMSVGVNRRVLYVALLLHDVGKGSGRDHSEYGAELALQVCPRLGFDEADTELVAWLVRNHLVMSDVAQKRDLAEPRTVRDFAAIVRTPTRLRLLTVLTVCDIIGVGPGVWNNWKAVLIRALYQNTIEVLTGSGGHTVGRSDREHAAKAALAHALPGWPTADVEAETARHYPPYWIGLDTRTHAIFAELVRAMPADAPAIRIELNEARDATEACFAMPDHPGIFARLAGALALAGANVVDARTYTSNDGIATAAFWIQDKEGRPYEHARLDRLRASVTRILAGEISARSALRDREQIKKRQRDFIVPTRIRFDNLGSDIYTIIEVETRDRPGLLHDLARTLTANNVSIASAIIATYGEQAVDVFYVKDLYGLKLHAETRRRALETRLRAAISPHTGPER